MSSSAVPNHVTESMSDRRKQRELAEARQSGNAAPEIDVKTGSIINPHNPEFLTRRPWYLGDNDAGPSLDHQADQRDVADRVGISLSTSDALLAEERKRVKALRKTDKSLKIGTWVEALKYNRKPYLMCQVVKVKRKKKKNSMQEVDLKYEDGSIEKGVKFMVGSDRIRITKTGARSFGIDYSLVGKSTYDSKRDSYHGYEVTDFNRATNEKFQDRDVLRRKLRDEELAKQDKKLKDEDGTSSKNKGGSDSGSDSDYDSDEGQSSDDEFVQKDEDDKMFTSRLARQGGVGGAQMKVTARNLRIREDTAKYLRNLDPNSAYYDPKSRSMRDNPNPEMTADDLQFAGDNFARVSGDAVGLADTQLFAWEATDKGVQEIHPQANPSQAEMMKRQFKEKSSDLKLKQRKAVLDKYGGAEYLDGKDGLGGATAKSVSRNANPGDSNNVDNRKVRFGVSVTAEQYTRDGRMVKGATSKMRVNQKSKYEEDVFINGHTSVWGSFFHRGAFRWGFADDHSLLKNAYCVGENGRRANDEANEMRHGTGVVGSAAMAQAREMLKVGGSRSSSSAPPTSSALYGEADQSQSFDQEKLKAARERLEKKNHDSFQSDDRKRKYNSVDAEVDVTAEDMEAFRMTKNRTDDPMSKLKNDELLEYKK